MKTFFYTTMLLLLIFVSSCAEDDEPITIITASDFSFTIDEIQEEGASIGTISATTTEGTISYSITSSLPSGAIAIDSATGELTVLDSSAFDFETNPTITATVAIIANGITETVEVSINLNDVTGVRSYLLTSQQDYIVANDGDWIEITEAEYNNLATNLNNVSTAGLSDGVFESNPGSLDSNGGSGYTMCTQNTSDTNLRIKEDNYVFAFKYVSMVATTRTTDRVKISSSTTITDTFTDLGSTLASHSGMGVHYFVIKGNNTKNSGDGYLAIYSSNSTGKKLWQVIQIITEVVIIVR